jgi:hypothetical protein
MKDENFNPNITGRIKPKMNSTKRAISNSNINRINQINSTINLNEDNDIEMKIENISYHEIKPKIEKKIDVQNADEYFDDICHELFTNEEKCLVDPKYMSNQSDINHRMRAILIDWLIDVHLKYKLVPQTMYIAVNLIDKYLEIEIPNTRTRSVNELRIGRYYCCNIEYHYNMEPKSVF